MIGQTLIDPAFSSRVCLTLLHSLWQFAALVVVVWCLKLIWKNQSVERRYTVHVFALLVGIAALPVTFLVINSAEERVDSVSHAPTANAPSESRITTAEKSTYIIPAKFQTIEPSIENAENNSANQTSSVADSPGSILHEWLQITPWIVAFYILGVGLMLARLIVSMIKVNRLSRQAMVIKEGPLVESLRSLAKQWSMKMVPVLAEAEQIVVPTVVGLIRPLILLPASVVSGLTPDELELILAHELAHVRRYDMWVNLLQRLAEAILFFNPALWYLSRQISGLREFCCDELTCRDQAASNFERKVRYATALLRVVELSKPNLATNPELASLAANGHSPSEVRRRVARLFGEPLREPLRLTRSMTYAVLALLLIGGPAVWSTYAENQSPAKTVQQENETIENELETIEEVGTTQKFSFGSKLEIVSIGTYGETPERWWDANGTLQESVPYRIKGAKVYPNENQIGRQLVFRIHDLPPKATVKWDLSNTGSSANGDVVPSGNKSPQEYDSYYSKVFSTAKKKKSFGLGVGIASGDWTTVTEGNQSASSTATTDNQGIIFSGAFTKKNRFTKKDEIVTVVTHSLQESDVRVIAIDSNGKTHTASKSAQQYAGGDVKVHQARWYFTSLDLEALDRFEFQTRPFEYIEFKNLPLNPQAKQKTAENKETPPVPKAESTKTTLPDAQTQKTTNTAASLPVKQPPTAKLSFVIAQHVILLEGKEIITWEEIDDLFGTLPDTSLISPAFYFTRGAFEAGVYKQSKEKMSGLRRKYKFGSSSEGSLWPRTAFRYDNIKTVDDLSPDPALKMTGTIVDQKGTPIEGAEVALILPVDQSIGYKTYDAAFVLGRIRNRLEHVMTLSDSTGQFDLYPPEEVKYYILAMHPGSGFALVRSDRIQADQKIKLLPWAGLKTELGEVPNETQTVDLTTRIEADQGWPEIAFNQYWSDLPQEVQEQGFVYNQIPPFSRVTISRSFKQPGGGGISLPGASVSMMPGEKREIGLGPLSEQQRLRLKSMRDFSRERRRKFEEKAKAK